MKNVMPHFSLKEISGNEILAFTDTVVSFVQLPNETTMRGAYKTFLCTSPALNTSTIMPRPAALNFRKRIVKDLKEVGFFKSGHLDQTLYQSFIELQDLEKIANWDVHVDTMNEMRGKNYELTKGKFGPLLERKPGAIGIDKGIIYDGRVQVGSIKMKTRGSYSHVYEVINAEGYTIAIANLFQKGNRGNVKPFATEKFKWIYYKRDKEGKSPTVNAKLYQIAKHLIEGGFL